MGRRFFTVNVAITLLPALYFFPSALTALEISLKPRGWKSVDNAVARILFACTLVPPSGAATSLAVLTATGVMSPALITLGASALVIATAVWSLPADLLVRVRLSWPFLVVCGAIVYLCSLLPRAPAHFASANLKVATMAVTSTPQTISWALCTTCIRHLWIAVGSLACIGSMAAFSRVKPHGSYYSPEYCLESFVMGGLVVGVLDKQHRQVRRCQHDGVSPGVLDGERIVELSDGGERGDGDGGGFGGVAMVIARQHGHRVAVVPSHITLFPRVGALDCWAKPVHILVVRVSSCLSVVSSLMLTVRFAVDCALRHPVVFVSLHHFNFEEAVRHVVEMFRTHGRMLLINDAMVLAGLTFSFVVAGAIPVIVSIVWVTLSIWTSSPTIVVIIVSVCTVATVLATLEVVLLYAVEPVVVCIAQMPESWGESHSRRPHDKVYQVWQELQLLHPPSAKARG